MRPSLFAASLVALMSLATVPAYSQENQTRTLTVSGEGEVSAAPDMAVISIGVVSEAQSAAEALEKNSAQMAATIEKLKAQGIAARDLQTSGLSVSPRYASRTSASSPRPTQPAEDDAPKIVGYTARNAVTARLRNLEKAGGVIDEAARSGANSLGGISFGFANPAPMVDEARRKAVADAKARAALYAEAAGVELGPLMSIQDGYARLPQPKGGFVAFDAVRERSAPIEAGEASVSANVTLVYAIE